MTCSIFIYRLYDLADEIELEKAQSLWSAQNQVSRLRLTRVSPKAIAFKNPPVTVELGTHEVTLACHSYTAEVRAKIYDLGVISVILRIDMPPHVEYDTLLDAALDIDRIPEEKFLAHVESVLSTIRPAIINERKPEFDEDFVVFYFNQWKDWDAVPLLLRDKQPVSEATRKETLENRLSYADDITILTWDTALVYDPTGSFDIPDLLEFANAQFLELRYYDYILDHVIDNMYESIEEASIRNGYHKLGKYRTIRRQLLALMADIVTITGKIQNSLRVTEDVFYARVYASYLKLLRVSDWRESIDKKIETIQHGYNQLNDEVVTSRAELLEIAIVLLIVLEVILSLTK